MKNIIITGASRGIGAGILRELAIAGHRVILNYLYSEEKALKLKEELTKNGCEVKLFKADVSKRNDVKKLIDFSIKQMGNIDVLINNAGISECKMFCDITDDAWNNMLQMNLNSVYYCIQEVLPEMIKKKEGCIINISSVWGIVGASCESHYAASKAAVDALTKSLAKELGPSNIRVNSIAPGDIDTDMNKCFTQEEINMIKEEIPLLRIGKPLDIAKCVKWLIDDEYTTGQVISVNGGWVIT